MSPYQFVENVAKTRLPDVFNPWAEVCPIADLPDAPKVRRENLVSALERALEIRVDSLLVGRDLGYRGGRRTGLALTDEAHLPAFSRMYGGVSLRRATRGPEVAERTARMFWEIISGLHTPVFTWNVFPYHPYESGNPLSNRCHSHTERDACKTILVALIQLLKPSRVIAVGNDAQVGLTALGIECVKVRHPSYGGKADFVEGMLALHPGLSSVGVSGETQPVLI